MQSEEFQKRGGRPTSYNPGYSWLSTVDHLGCSDPTPKYNDMETPSGESRVVRDAMPAGDWGSFRLNASSAKINLRGND